MTLWPRRAIAAYEIVAGGIGILGFAATAPAVMSGVVPADVFVVLSATAVASLMAGVQFWRGRPSGVRSSLAVQGSQALGVSVPGFAYSLGLTFRFDVGWRGAYAPALPINHFLLRLGANEYGPMGVVNVLALAAFGVVWYVAVVERRRLRERTGAEAPAA
jgi:hypothetical protein